MKTTRIIGTCIAAIVVTTTLIWMFDGDATSAQTPPTKLARGNGDGEGAAPTDGGDRHEGSADGTATKPKTVRLDIAAEAMTRDPVPGAVVTITEIDGVGPGRLTATPHDGNGIVQETRRKLRVVASGTTDGHGRFKAKVPATGVFSVEVAPPPGSRWVNWDTPPLPVGFGCKHACVEVVVQDGEFLWRADGATGTYRRVNAQEQTYFEPLTFLFNCV